MTMTKKELKTISAVAEQLGLNVVGGRFAPPTLGDLPESFSIRVKSEGVKFDRESAHANDESELIEYSSAKHRGRDGQVFQFVIIPAVNFNALHESLRQKSSSELVRGVTYIRIIGSGEHQVTAQRGFVCHGPFAGERDFATYLECAAKSLGLSFDEAFGR
jgi:hypothetical protein